MIELELDRKTSEIAAQIINWRRQFHQQPELELNCYQTAAVVSRHLLDLGLEVQTGIAETGVIGVLRSPDPGPVVALRVDMDALPIGEQTGLPFASRVDGVMHACGHDGHTAIGMGVASVLAHCRDSLQGTVKFIFQPGEEFPGGSKIMITGGALDNPKVDAILGGHIYPNLPLGKVGVRYGVMTAADDEFTVELLGTGGHGAYPHQCADPIVAAGHLITTLQSIVARNTDPLDSLVISLGQITGGSGHNVIPERVILKGTIRSISECSRETAHQRLQEILNGIRQTFGVEYLLEMIPGNPSLRCDHQLTAFVEESLVDLVGREQVISIPAPSMGAEDFAYFAEQVPATYLRLGSRDEAGGYVHALHTPYFDFDEQILIDGTKIFAKLISRLLARVTRRSA
jgi:amidohydrolase